MTRFAKLAISAATALSLSLAPMPAAAAPDAEDVIGTVAGLAILGLIAKSASDRKDRRNSATQSNTYYDPYSSIEDRNGRIIDGDIRPANNDKFRAKDKHRGYKKAKLPDRCIRVVETRRSDRLVYGERCLNRHYKFAAKLPEHCERFVRTERGLRAVYPARCLARDGWRVARR